MSPKQLKTCADRLPEPLRSRFLTMHGRATTLVLEAAAIRHEAWAMWREATRDEREIEAARKALAAQQREDRVLRRRREHQQREAVKALAARQRAEYRAEYERRKAEAREMREMLR